MKTKSGRLPRPNERHVNDLRDEDNAAPCATPAPRPPKGEAKPTIVDMEPFDGIAAIMALEDDEESDANTLDQLPPHEAEYVLNKVRAIRKHKTKKKKRAETETKQRRSEPAFPGDGDREIRLHPFWQALDKKHSGRVPVMRQALVIERWIYLVTGDDTQQRMLSQLVFWFKTVKYRNYVQGGLDRIRARLVDADDHAVVAKTDEQMAAEIGKPVGTIKRHRAALIKRGLIVVTMKSFYGKRTCHYRIDWDALQEAFEAGGGDMRLFKLTPVTVNELDRLDDEEPERIVERGSDDE